MTCVGVDHPNLQGRIADDLGNTDCPGQVLLLHPEREIPIIENLVGLNGATGSSIRAIALVDD